MTFLSFLRNDPRRPYFIVAAMISAAILLALAIAPSSSQENGSTFVVNTVEDRAEVCGEEGLCSFREAIVAVNDASSSAGPHTIAFEIPGSGPHTLEPEFLPTITSPVVIDGYTQPGASPNTLDEGNNADLRIVLSGAQAGLGTHGLELRGGNSVVRGLVINGFSENGIVFRLGSNNVVEGNFIGTDVSGTSAVGNGYDGIGILDSSNNLIGGTTPAARNVISGNAEGGIAVVNGPSTGNKIQGNYIGTDKTGETAIGNGVRGILVSAEIGRTNYSSANIIGGTEPGASNLISGNPVGISVFRGEDNTIQGNLIGTDVTGTTALPNGDPNDPGDPIGVGTGVLIDEASNNQVGGTEPGAGNVLSGNARVGLMIATSAESATGNVIQGNLIGTAKNGQDPLGNFRGGVMLNAVTDSADVAHNTIGGSGDGEGNIISGNHGSGVQVIGNRAFLNSIQGNLIGVAEDGETPLGNQEHGVFISDSSDNFIGGPNENEGNVIAFNGESLEQRGHGVVIESGSRNLIRFNSIYENAGRGIDLGNDSFTINDWLDQDDGANLLQNTPFVSGVEFSPDEKVIEWTLHSTPNTDFTLDFYANDDPDPSGFGEGRRHLETRVGTTDGDGDLIVEIAIGVDEEFIAATATSASHSTSEFSMVDTSGDAIADIWAIDGIDVNEDGTTDLNLFELGLDPNKKNIFVEVDAMQGFAPSEEMRDLLINGRDGLPEPEGFANVPAELANNPDDSEGINLHLIMGGDLNIPVQPWPQLQNGWPVAFDDMKHGTAANEHRDGTFGTPEERADPNWPNIREAKRLVFRYAAIVHSFGQDSDWGIAEFHGNDFIVSLGEWPADENAINTRHDPLAEADVFMHELGHTLGLRHGGDQNDNHKPNYRSVMNYIWSVQRPGYPEGYRLDYSRDELREIDESAIDQALGFGGIIDVRVPVGPILDENGDPQPQLIVREGGAINLDGDENSLGEVPRDVNFQEGDQGHPGDTLTAHEDWSNLKFHFLHRPEFSPRGEREVSGPELTLEHHEQLAAIGDAPGEFHFSHVNYEHTGGEGTVTIRVVRRAGKVGDVSVDVSTSDGTAVASEDYVPVDETLTMSHAEHAVTFTIDILQGAEPGEEKTIHLTLSNPTGGATLASASTEAVLRITTEEDALVVTTTNDLGPGSLRRAINDANANEGHDTIVFDIREDGVQTITPLSPLPEITEPVTIDGYTQPGASPNTLEHGNDANLLIELDGSEIDEDGVAGLAITGGGSTVRGLVINGFDTFLGRGGISLEDDGDNVIQGNFLGTDASGEIAVGNRYGIFLASGGNTIGGDIAAARNLISGNADNGVHFNISGSDNNVVQGNYIGTDRHGLEPLGNGGLGMSVSGAGNQIGGNGPGAGNVVSGNNQSGIFFTFSSGGVIQGNLIGTDRDGTSPIGNGGNGLRFHSGAAHVIGGSEAGAGNVISGNDGDGIALAAEDGNVVQGNRIGTDINGEFELPNSGHGIEIRTSDNQIGGTEPEAGNVISGNDENGIHIEARFFPSVASGNVIEGNLIGTQADGVSPLGNKQNGIAIFYAENNTIGGTEPGAGNTIAFNGDPGEIYFGTRLGAGIVAHNIGSGSIAGNTVLGNAIFENALLGIDLVGDDFLDEHGVTQNDDGDTDTGINDQQNFPVLTTVSTTGDGSGTLIEGTLNSRPNQTFHIEFFANSDVDPSGFGEGERFIGATQVTTDDDGNASFAATVTTVVESGQFITSTATGEDNSTSEFSEAFQIEVEQFTLTVQDPMGEGTVEPGPGTHDYAEGSDVELQATPADGWGFSHWMIDGEQGPETPSTIISMTSDRTVQAVFVVIETCVDLIAGQDIVAGEVCASHDADELTVTYTTIDGWVLKETHLAVSVDEPGTGEWIDQDNRWQSEPGHPAPGRFPHQFDHGLDGVDTYIYTIPLDEISNGVEGTSDLYIGAHAVVHGDADESAWSAGERFTDQGSWATYFEHTVR